MLGLGFARLTMRGVGGLEERTKNLYVEASAAVATYN